MPTYEFRCPKGHGFDRFYRMISTAPMELPCPECGATASRQISGGAGFAFKGSGFYLTDYGKNAHRGTAPDKKGTGDAGGGGGGGDSGKSSDSTASGSKPAGDASAKSSGDSAAKPAASEKPAAVKPPKPKSE